MNDDAYRYPAAEASESHRPKVGYWSACPACGSADFKSRVIVCLRCGRIHAAIAKTESLEGWKCGDDKCEGPLQWALPFQALGPFIVFCSPQRRARHGFLWLRKCSEPGVHVHQRCSRCGWTGIAMVDGRWQ